MPPSPLRPNLNPAPNTPPLRDIAFIMLGLALLWVPVLALHLTPALFALLITYGATRALAARLRTRRPAMRHAEGLALLASLVLLGLVLTLLLNWAADARGTLPRMLQQMAAILERLRSTLPAVVADHVPSSIEALRDLAVAWLRAHAAEVQLWSGHTLRGLGYVLAGIVIGALMAMQMPVNAAAPAPAGAGAAPHAAVLPAWLRRQFDELVNCFTNVVFAQVRIAAINAVLTAVFLLGILPLLGRPLPMAGTLVALTFFTGLLPVVGNLISNTVITIFALSSSLLDAALALAWLVGIHKLEYFLNAHIIGTRIRARSWELLIVMLLFEATFGLAGLISAPVIYAQLKQMLYQRGWVD